MKMVIFMIFLTCTFSVAAAQEFPELGVRVETVAENLIVPWEIEFASDGRIFFTERIGELRVIQNGELLSESVISLQVSGTEGGLLGLALDPNFDENHFLYLYYSYVEGSQIYNRVVRYTENNNSLSEETIILDKIPGSQWHDGGRIKFGPDGKLYIATGDAADWNLAQKLDSLAGKILRINSDGSIPDDNPLKDSEVFSYGHRNPQGMDWHPEDEVLVVTEHGPSGERGVANDEINVIIPGGNYGWPDIVGDESLEGLEEPIIHSGDETWAPSGAAFYDSDKIADWYGKFFVATLYGKHLRMLDLENSQGEKLFFGEYGRLRNAAMGPDGHLYIMTSNNDGRGSPSSNDDQILRIVPLITEEQVSNASMSPLKQVQAGITPQDISCKEGLKLVIKAGNGMPACVKEASVKRLSEIGWSQ